MPDIMHKTLQLFTIPMICLITWHAKLTDFLQCLDFGFTKVDDRCIFGSDANQTALDRSGPVSALDCQKIGPPVKKPVQLGRIAILPDPSSVICHVIH